MNLLYVSMLLFLLKLFYSIKGQGIPQYKCPKVSCSSNPIRPNSICWRNITNGNSVSIKMYNCPSGQYCRVPQNYQDISNYNTSLLYCENFPINYWSGRRIGDLVEYDYCYEHSNCASLKCVKNQCVGLSEGSECNSTVQCSSRTFCNKGICTIRVNEGNKCINNENCINQAGCLNGICVKRYSVNSGISLNSTNQEDGFTFCSSQWANEKSLCEDLLLIGQDPYYCIPEYGCNYTTSITKKVVNLNFCTCDLSGNGYAYCRQSSNSYAKYKFIRSEYYMYSIPCHYYNKEGCSLTPSYYNQQIDMAKIDYQNINSSASRLVSCIFTLSPPINPVDCITPPCFQEITATQISNESWYHNLTNYFLLIYFLIIF